MPLETNQIITDMKQLFAAMHEDGLEEFMPTVEFYRDDRLIAGLIVTMDEDREEFARNVWRAAYGFTPDVIVLAVDALTRVLPPDRSFRDVERGELQQDREGGNPSVRDAFVVHVVSDDNSIVAMHPYRAVPHGVIWDDDPLVMDEVTQGRKNEGLIIDILSDAMKFRRRDGETIIEAAKRVWEEKGNPLPGDDPDGMLRLHTDLATAKMLAKRAVAVRYMAEKRHEAIVLESIESDPQVGVLPADAFVAGPTNVALRRLLDDELLRDLDPERGDK